MLGLYESKHGNGEKTPGTRKELFTSKMTQSHGHAIVYGASGLIGWALVDQLLSSYPSVDTFSEVTAVTNRPINPSKCHWPKPGFDRPELQLVSGIDLRHADGVTLAESLKQAVKGIERVTHVYYLGLSPLSRC